jgi:hypothetical protein
MRILEIDFNYSTVPSRHKTPAAAVLPAVVVQGTLLSDQWAYTHAKERHRARLGLASLEGVSHAMLVLL